MKPISAEQVAVKSECLQGLRVLVVEDEPDTRGFLTIMLKQNGATVETACSAAEAMTQMEQFAPNMLVSDIGMPEEDGFSLIRRVRSRESACNAEPLPAIALTAYAGAEDRRRALAEGFQEHVAKPVDPLEMISLLARFASV